ncbi:hypothetical protein Pmani_020282 [Petrolisthes manimaculis]|uniref:DBF4-type domain-containing protein n=1 Tax=Petrolisthes manimaculis TaxID=1843537 RepID=A0AAE1PJ19_9EUCA|nr:hypothetical protein Pmani_020282 [Petrolisthes manimaculis]
MVSPSKKRQIKGRVNTGHKTHRKGDKSNTRLPYKPLLNKKFYLDIRGYRNTPTIASDIHNLGGIVEEFFSREINYVISSRVQQQQQQQQQQPGGGGGGSSSEQLPSPSGIQIASPLTPHQALSSLASTSHDSPLTVDSPREDAGKKRVRTRAEVLLERACVRRPGTSDVLENARLWNVPVWSLAKLLKWLSVLKQSELYRPPRTTHGTTTSTTTPTGRTNTASYTHSSSLTKVQRLREPFIKTEPFSRQYRPLYKELSAWPELNLTNPTGVSPFADPKQTKPQANLKTSSTVRDDHKEKRTKERNRGAIRAKEGGGYCELCTVNYTNLRLHLQSDLHLAFVRNDTNYQYLDELISGHKQDHQLFAASK